MYIDFISFCIELITESCGIIKIKIKTIRRDLKYVFETRSVYLKCSSAANIVRCSALSPWYRTIKLEKALTYCFVVFFLLFHATISHEWCMKLKCMISVFAMALRGNDMVFLRTTKP